MLGQEHPHYTVGLRKTGGKEGDEMDRTGEVKLKSQPAKALHRPAFGGVVWEHEYSIIIIKNISATANYQNRRPKIIFIFSYRVLY